jgi:hypothetical protein
MGIIEDGKGGSAWGSFGVGFICVFFWDFEDYYMGGEIFYWSFWEDGKVG